MTAVDVPEQPFDPTTGPTMWPECTECETTYTLRRAISWTKGWLWVWYPDCKCSKRKKPAPAAARMMTAEGSVRTS